MARPRRTDFEGAWHYVFHHGRGGNLFGDSLDVLAFLESCHAALERFGMELHGYCLIPSGYRLLLRSRAGRLSSAMKSLGFRYGQWVRARDGRCDRLYAGRFGSGLLAGEEQVARTLAFLHREPLESGIIEDLRQPAWTSHGAYIGLEPRPDCLTTEVLLDRFGGQDALHRFVVEATGLVARGDPTRHGQAELGAFLAAVCRFTGTDPQFLTRTRAGPGANPARRFAIWALTEDGRWSQREIACALRTSTSVVATTMARLRRGVRSGILAAWIEGWTPGLDPGPDEQDPGPDEQDPGPHEQDPGPHEQDPGPDEQDPGPDEQDPGPHEQDPGPH